MSEARNTEPSERDRLRVQANAFEFIVTDALANLSVASVALQALMETPVKDEAEKQAQEWTIAGVYSLVHKTANDLQAALDRLEAQS